MTLRRAVNSASTQVSSSSSSSEKAAAEIVPERIVIVHRVMVGEGGPKLFPAVSGLLFGPALSPAEHSAVVGL